MASREPSCPAPPTDCSFATFVYHSDDWSIQDWTTGAPMEPVPVPADVSVVSPYREHHAQTVGEVEPARNDDRVHQATDMAWRRLLISYRSSNLQAQATRRPSVLHTNTLGGGWCITLCVVSWYLYFVPYFKPEGANGWSTSR